MPECHKCANNQANNIACLKCSGPSDGPNNHGQIHVSVDQVAAFIPAPVHPEADASYDIALEVLKSFAALGLIEREIATARMRGEQYPAITARLNVMLAKRITVQGVHARAKKAVKTYPILTELFRGMVVKQAKRKKKGQAQ